MGLRRNVIANVIGQGWTTLVGLAFIPLYIHFLGIEAYGLIGIFALLQTWLSLLDFGLTPALSREMARFTGGAHDAQSIRDLLRSVELATVAVAVLLVLVLWFASGWLASEWLHVESLPLDTVAQALAVIGVVVASRSVENVYRGSLAALQRQVTLNAITGLVATLRAAGSVVVLAVISPTIIAFFLWQGFVSALSAAGMAIVVHQSLPTASRAARFSFAPLRNVWGFATGSLLITLLGFLLSQLDKVVLSSLLSLSAFAVYSLAYTLASGIRLLGQPIDQATFPRLTQLFQRSDERGLSTLYHKATQYKAVLTGGLGIFFALYGAEVLRLWTQDPKLATDTYAVLWILAIGMVLNGIMVGPYHLQMAAGWTSLLVKVNLIMVAVFVPAIYVLTQQFGMTGAALAWAGLNLVYVLASVRLMHRRLLPGELKEWYLKDLLLPVGAAAAIAVVLRPFAPASGAIAATVIFLGIALVATFIASSLAASHVRRDVARQVRHAFRKSSSCRKVHP